MGIDFNIGLFFLGALGALLTVYLAKQEVVPEFRVIFDTSDMEKEIGRHQDHIKKTEEDVDDIQTKLRDASVPAAQKKYLTTVLNSSMPELQAGRTRLEKLERAVVKSRAFSRSLGFVFYVGLGGVFGALLADKITVEGLSGKLPTVFQSIVIGATWTTYLSAIGFRSNQAKADDRIETVKKEAAESIEMLKKELTPIVTEKVASAEQAPKVKTSILAGEVGKMLVKELDRTNLAVQKKLDETKKMVRMDMKQIL